MARARPTAPSVSLFPFMSILACLVGTIVVMICVLSLIQAQSMGGRPREEVEAATEYVRADRLVQELRRRLDRERRDRTQLASTAVLVREENEELDRRIAVLRQRAEAAKAGEQTSRELQKELELLKVQLATLAKEKPDFQKQVESLEKELAARAKPPTEAAKVVVQPSGSGVAGNAAIFFVEAAAGAISLLGDDGTPTRITAGSIGKDEQYDAFLQNISRQRDSLLVFLVRTDGWGSYVNAAGWAEGTFGIRTGKLPIPGKGPIDLSRFREGAK